MLSNAKPNEWDILALQEPWFDHLGKTRANPKWSATYPTPKGRDNLPHPRSIILVNTNIPTESITQIPIDSNDITAIKINTKHKTLTIINVYIANNNNDAITALQDAWETRETEFMPTTNTELLLLGDFNRHHPTWEGISNAHLTSPDRLLNPLLDLIINMRLEQALPKDTPTLQARNGGRWTRPDNVWRNAESPSTIITCDVQSNLLPTKTDHLPIVTILDLQYHPITTPRRFNFKRANWEKYEEILEERLNRSETLNRPSFQSAEGLEEAVNELYRILQDVTEETIPMIKPLPHLKHWWNDDLTLKRKEKNRASAARFEWRGTPDHPAHEEFRKISREYARDIDTAKANHWKEWIEEVQGNDLWMVNKYMNSSPSDFSCQRIPQLKQINSTKTKTSKEKAERLAQVFFPIPRDTPESLPPFIERDPPKAPPNEFTIFTAERVEEALSKLKPHKAPGNSGIPNAALKQCAIMLSPFLAKIYTAICQLNYYPHKFRNINQIVIRKPGRPSYKEANAYCLIALIETIAKVQSAIITKDLSYICEKNGLLPKNQFGG